MGQQVGGSRKRTLSLGRLVHQVGVQYFNTKRTGKPLSFFRECHKICVRIGPLCLSSFWWGQVAKMGMARPVRRDLKYWSKRCLECLGVQWQAEDGRSQMDLRCGFFGGHITNWSWSWLGGDLVSCRRGWGPPCRAHIQARGAVPSQHIIAFGNYVGLTLQPKLSLNI